MSLRNVKIKNNNNNKKYLRKYNFLGKCYISMTLNCYKNNYLLFFSFIY